MKSNEAEKEEVLAQRARDVELARKDHVESEASQGEQERVGTHEVQQVETL